MSEQSNLPYLPEWPTAAEAAAWIEAHTGQPWPVAKLLESPAEMYLEIRAKVDEPELVRQHVFQGRDSIYVNLRFSGDRQALAFSRTEGRLSMFQRPGDDTVVHLTPPLRFHVDEIRFSRTNLMGLVDAVTRGVNLHDERRLQVNAGALQLTLDKGSVAWVEANGGLEALAGAKYELLSFQPLEALEAAPSSPARPPLPDGREGDAILLARHEQLAAEGASNKDTYAEVGREFGISRQRVSQRIGRIKKKEVQESSAFGAMTSTLKKKKNK